MAPDYHRHQEVYDQKLVDATAMLRLADQLREETIPGFTNLLISFIKQVIADEYFFC